MTDDSFPYKLLKKDGKKQVLLFGETFVKFITLHTLDYPGTHWEKEHYVLAFPNGYGASLIRGRGTYAHGNTWELAVLKDGEITYTSGITINGIKVDDVIGHVPPAEVRRLLETIKSLT